MENCVCIIYLENGRKGTGFFSKIPFLNNYLPVLITNNHVLNESDIENGKTIKLMINNTVKTIKIDNSRKKYTNPDYGVDITIIEIKPKKDEIGVYNYLELDENDINKKKENIGLEYPNKSIYILHYPNGKLNVSFGIIKDIIENKKINHYCTTEEGSSGSPILSLETFKIIGIHCGCYPKNIKLNYGTFIKYAIYLFNFNNNNKYKIKINKQKQIEKSSLSEIFFYKNNTNPYYLKDSYYNKNKVQNPGKINNKINLNEDNLNLRTIGNISNLKYCDNYIIKTDENIPSNIGYNYQFTPKSLSRERKNNTKLYNYNKIDPNNRIYNEAEDDSPELFNKKISLISLGFDDKKNRIFDNENVVSKLKRIYINKNKKNNNLKLNKGNNERNTQTPISARQNIDIYKQNTNNNFRMSFPQMISNKKEKIYEYMKYNLLINRNYNNGNINKIRSKKENLENKYDIKNEEKNNKSDSEFDDRNNKYSFEQFLYETENNSKKFSIPNFDEENYSYINPNEELTFGNLVQDKKSENRNIFKKSIINNDEIFKKYFKQLK